METTKMVPAAASPDARRSRARETDDLFEKVLASMNAGRWKPIPQSEYSLIAEVCAEAIDLDHAEGRR